MQFSSALLGSLLAAAALARGIPKTAHHKTAAAAAPASTSSSSGGSGGGSSGGSGGGQISGLDADQSKNAQAIMSEAKSEGLPTQACVAGIATALQESTLYVYANPTVPQSMSLPYQKVGSNLDSVGLFQQRPEYYPNVAADMNPAQSAAQFFTAMKAISGWQTMDVSTLCQTVQKAAAGNLYGQRVAQAQTICKTGGFS